MVGIRDFNLISSSNNFLAKYLGGFGGGKVQMYPKVDVYEFPRLSISKMKIQKVIFGSKKENFDEKI